MDVHRLFVRRPAGAQQGIDETGQAIGLADYDAGVFAKLFVIELPLEQLSSTAYPAQRVFDLMCELPDHLPAGAVLDQQCVLAADTRTPGDVGHLDQQQIGVAAER